MSKYKNKGSRALDFRVGAQKYKVPAGGEVELPEFVVTGRGLPLTKVDGDGPVKDAPPTDPIARLWYDRAFEMRSALDAMGPRLSAANDFVSSVRVHLSLGPEDSVMERLDALLMAEEEAGVLREQLVALTPQATDAKMGALSMAESEPKPAKPAKPKP